MEQVLAGLIAAVGGVGLVAVLAIFFWDRVERFLSFVGTVLSRIPPLYRFGRRQAVRFAMQARLHRLARRIGRRAPLAARRVRIRWVDASTTTREAFLSRRRVVIRLRDTPNSDENFVHAAVLLVGDGLLPRLEAQLSPDQDRALKLYVAGKLLEAARDSVRSYYIATYVGPETEASSRVAEYWDAFEELTPAGLFFEVMLPELEFLGDKVFGRRPIAQVPPEVDRTIGFLVGVARRRAQEEINLTLDLEYCRFAVVIVGRPEKLGSPTPWIRYVNDALATRGIESIYLIGFWTNRRVMHSIAEAFRRQYSARAQVQEEVLLADGRRAKAYVVQMRSRRPSIYRVRGSETAALLRTGSPPYESRSLLGTVVSFGGGGYGFLALDDGRDDVFFHRSECENDPAFISRGDRVECDVERASDGWRASRVRFVRCLLPDGPPLPSAPTTETASLLASRPPTTPSGPPGYRGTVQRFGAGGYGFLRLDGETQDLYFRREDCVDAPDFIDRGMTVWVDSVDPGGNHAYGVRFDPLSERPATPLPESEEGEPGPYAARVVRFGGGGYGFLRIDGDGRDLYFHRDDCHDAPEFIERGTRVWVDEVDFVETRARGVSFDSAT
ncbi:MAG TPA: cold shock domain-containing protein [Solirubrobacteraceae bacterium]|jgi:cold shock CspA family protein